MYVMYVRVCMYVGLCVYVVYNVCMYVCMYVSNVSMRVYKCVLIYSIVSW
jgi:hypothetical protein